MSRLVGSEFEVACREADGLVSVVVVLGLVFLQEVLEVVLHRVSGGYCKGWSVRIKANTWILNAVVEQAQWPLGLVGYP